MEQYISTLFWSADEYRDFLYELTQLGRQASVGTKVKLAKTVGVSGAYISKVISKKSHLSHEQALILAEKLTFSESETYAFLDMISLAKTDSKKMQKILNFRIKKYFSVSFIPEIKTSAATATPNYWWQFKLANLLIGSEPKSVTQLAEALQTTEERVVFLIEQIKEVYKIDKTEVNNKQFFSLGVENFQFFLREPSSKSLYDLSMSVRRMATYSLETRYPIRFVDQDEHFASGSYVVPLSPENINKIKILFVNLIKDLEKEFQKIKVTDNSKLTAICFDFFDV